MIDFFPIKYYSVVFYNVLLIMVLMTYMQSNQYAIDNQASLKSKKSTGIFLLFFLIVYIGLRPITFSYFGDMGMYNIYFNSYAEGQPLLLAGKDIGFEIFMKLCSYIMTPQFFFLTISFLYIFPMYKASKVLFNDYWFYCFLMLVASFSFWGAATNGLRNGIATSFFLMAFISEKKYVRFAFMLLAISFHKSLLITSAAFLITLYYANTKMYLRFWFLAIPLSLALGSFWESLFLNFGFGQEEKLAIYLIESDELQEQFTNTGFRWDFLLYSATGVFAGWYFIFKKQFKDVLYAHMFNTYLVANAFWILVIRANYSNRFAYLSWFMLGIIIMYPMLKMQFFKKQHQVVGRIILLYFLFTYVLNVVLSKF